MNIKGHSLTLVQGHLDSTFSNFFYLETVRPIEAKFHVDPPWNGGTKVCSNGPSHMSNMTIMPYFMARSDLVPYAFVWEKGKTMDFSETIQF